MQATTTFYPDAFPDRPDYDTAVTRALLQAVGRGELGEALRIHQPGEVVAFSVLDRTQAGFADAIEAAGENGFGAILRLAGGRAAVFHRDTIAFAWCVPDAEPRDGIAARFDLCAAIIRDALRALGVDARIGAVPDEYCPGDHSVNAGGRTKIMGVGQRIVRGAAHVGGVIVVDGSQRIRDVLGPVYGALGQPFDPGTVGSIADEIGPVSREDVVAALRASFGSHRRLEDGVLPPGLLDAAEPLARDHALDARAAASASTPG